MIVFLIIRSVFAANQTAPDLKIILGPVFPQPVNSTETEQIVY